MIAVVDEDFSFFLYVYIIKIKSLKALNDRKIILLSKASNDFICLYMTAVNSSNYHLFMLPVATQSGNNFNNDYIAI